MDRQGGVAPFSVSAPVPTPIAVGARGIDVYDRQGVLDCVALKAGGYAFVWSKATEGVGFTNKFFEANWAAATELARGAYHYARPDLTRALDEAAYFIAVTLGLLGSGDRVALDLEVGDGDLFPWVIAWLTAVEQATGRVPYLYSRVDFLAAHGLLRPELARFPLWLAAPGETQPTAPAPLTLACWQKNWHATAPGVTGEVDEDLWVGEAA